WGFNGTERPGAVYLAAVLAGHSQKGLPAFGIYGRDVQDSNDTSIPTDVQGKLIQFARAGLAAVAMRGTSYLAMGGVSMGIAGSRRCDSVRRPRGATRSRRDSRASGNGPTTCRTAISSRPFCAPRSIGTESASRLSARPRTTP